MSFGTSIDNAGDLLLLDAIVDAKHGNEDQIQNYTLLFL